MGINEILEELRSRGIKVIKIIKTKPNSFQRYRLIGSNFDSAKTWTSWQLRTAYQSGEL
jgi:hypothetical protein